jgi:serine/threonine protein kinase
VRKIKANKLHLDQLLFEFDADQEAIDLIQQCLEINPAFRISIFDALASPYFHKLHNPQKELQTTHECKQQVFNFEHQIENKSRLQLREIMYQHLISFDPVWKSKIRVRNKQKKPSSSTRSAKPKPKTKTKPK